MGIIRFVGFGLLTFVFLFVVATVAAFVYLPWWLALPVSLAAMCCLLLAGKIALKKYAGRTLGKMMKTMEEAMGQQGKALRGARVEVHSVTRVASPSILENSIECDDNDLEVEYSVDVDEDHSVPDPACYRIDITVIPAPQDGPDPVWRPAFLRFILEPSPILPLGIKDFPMFQSGCPLEQIELVDGDHQGDEEEEGSEGLTACQGAGRFRALIRVPSDSRELEIYYFLEPIGQISLPGTE